jgi:transposase
MPHRSGQDSTLIAVIEMSQSSWLVAGIVPGIERHPAKKLEANEARLLRLLQRWRAEAERTRRKISQIAVAPCSSQRQAFEAGRDGVWLARWLQARDAEAQAYPRKGARGCTHFSAPIP